MHIAFSFSLPMVLMLNFFR